MLRIGEGVGFEECSELPRSEFGMKMGGYPEETGFVAV